MKFRGIRRGLLAGGAARPAQIILSNASQAEGTAIGTAIGTASVVNGTGVYTFSKTGDPDSAFTLTGAVLKNAIAFDYETATSHNVTLHADNGAGSVLNNTFVVSVSDIAAPVLSAATGNKTGGTTATLGVTTNGANGTLYAVATTSTTNPTAAQVRAGQDHTGAAAAFAGSQAISSSGAKTISATGLAAATAYFAHFMHEGLPAEQSAVLASASFTTDAVAAPVNTVAPVVSGTEADGSTLSCTTGTWTNSPSGYTYQWYQALLDGGGNVLVDGSGNPLGTPISSATASTHLLVTGDVAAKIFCTVTATNAGGSTAADSNVTGAIAAGGGAVSFDPAHATGITFSNGNKTITFNGGSASANTRSTTSHTTGKYYVEITINSLHAGDNIGGGLVNGSFAFNGSNFVGIDNNGIGVYTAGLTFLNAGSPVPAWQNPPAFGVGDVIGLAINLDNQKLWYRINNGQWDNNSGLDDAAGAIGGQSLVPLGGGGTSYYVAGDVENTVGNQVTVNLGGSGYAFTAPVGFNAW